MWHVIAPQVDLVRNALLGEERTEASCRVERPGRVLPPPLAADEKDRGLSPQPIETAEGWLVIYHGVRHTPAGAIYRVGLALLDLDDPRRVLKRGEEWVVGPRESYEVTGEIPNVVFPCGAVLDDATGELRLY